MEAGAVVQLKSGGPHMTVAGLDGGRAHVTWFDEKYFAGGHFQRAEFPVECLEVVD